MYIIYIYVYIYLPSTIKFTEYSSGLYGLNRLNMVKPTWNWDASPSFHWKTQTCQLQNQGPNAVRRTWSGVPGRGGDTMVIQLNGIIFYLYCMYMCIYIIICEYKYNFHIHILGLHISKYLYSYIIYNLDCFGLGIYL